MNKTTTYYYKDKPLFGLDIGFSSIKAMQTENHGGEHHVIGYGIGAFEAGAVKDGVIIDHERVAAAAVELFDKGLVGEINTKRVAIAIPTTRTFTRTMNLPPIKDDELAEAVRLEAEQFIPMPIDELYMDHVVIQRNDKGVELLSVAAPKKVIDSYLEFTRLIGLEAVAFDASILAAGRLFEKQDDHNDIPAVLIDFGSVSADITVHDRKVIVTGTIPQGGDTFTEMIAKKLRVSREEAHVIKTKYGLGKSKKQTEIIEVLKPSMDQIAKEIRRMIRYHEDRSDSKQKIEQIVTMGGGANMPGLSDYLTNILRLPVRTSNPWQNLKVHKLQPPGAHEKSMYVTVAGLSMIEPKELFV